MANPAHQRRGGWRGLVTAATAVMVAAAVTVPGAAAATERAPITLSDTSQTASWSGAFDVGALGVWLVASLPAGCTPELCDVVPLEVSLPPGTWERQPGGLLVAIQGQQVDTVGYDADLFVYGPDGSQAAASQSWMAHDAVWIENPANGVYRVVVVPRFVASQPIVEGVAESLRYEGFAEFEQGVTVERDELKGGEPYTRQFVAFGTTSPTPAVELLPDLVPTTPRNFHIETTAGAQHYFYADRGLRHQPSCYPAETLGLTEDEPAPGDGPLRCLRFDQGEHNFGDGPFELHVYEGTTDLYQRIYLSDGTVRQIGPLGEAHYSRSHLHFHALGFQEIKLYRIEDDGSLTFVADGTPKGICMGDIVNDWFGRADQPTAPLAYPVPGSCDDFAYQDPNDPTFPGRKYLQTGISVGWSDVYPWWIADQYVDITDAADGTYALVVRQDVGDRLREKDETNNSSMGCVRIEGEAAEEISCPAQPRAASDATAGRRWR